MKIHHIVLILICITLAGCASANPFVDVADSQGYIAGFWAGLWHGIILPFSFFLSLFNHDLAIYAVYNNGAWYDLGFVIGAGSTLSASVSKK